ncbi:hypothetical protein GCM10012285_45520 [Streptomyces kronopolitis]|uniref:Uncharacterized protein n=1 Tax=Streptomyces kronopolitis TaxID=1612435 RepID=A0ABQ2JUV8_9ACTN|nr:hypothetical protein GCM10012285_45520 [Streptomyces kronopolitis]
MARPRRDPTGFRHVVVNIIGKVPRTDPRAKAAEGAEWCRTGRAGRATPVRIRAVTVADGKGEKET